ncbi:MAG: ATP-binding protein, partial [bacterium]|nr:ATP-binding protein [bacterium]
LTTHTLKTKYSEVPFRGALPPEIASGLVLAEQLEARLPEKALELYARLADVNTRQLHALSRATGQRPAAPPARPPAALPVATGPAPPFATLLREGQIAAGNPLIFGFSNGQPQYRHPQEIKSMAVAGWQGSGKTLTSGYIVACLLLQYPTSEVYIIDPHHKHAESLTTLVKPLAVTPRLHLINPFDTPAILRTLNTTLDDRLENRQPSEPPLFLIIDELARLGKSLSDADFNAFIAFLERCTEETRKANLCFWGISQKWSARNFKNRKDIRECMPSLLIHKTKQGQAELLLEGRAEKKLVQRLSHPGEALLATSHDTDP